jgi:hypothetical protein
MTEAAIQPVRLSYHTRPARAAVTSPKLVWALLVASLALVVGACAAIQSKGPSEFFAGFSPDDLQTSINSRVNGPPCGGYGFSSGETSGGPFGGANAAAELTLSCVDPGDGTALAQGSAAAIESQLAHLGATVSGTRVRTTDTGARVTDLWEYTSDGIRGRISVEVHPGPDRQYDVVVHIDEPPKGELEGPSPVISAGPDV